MNEPINFALGTSTEYAPHTAAVIASIARHTPGPLQFVILHADVPLERQRLVERAAPGARFFWETITDSSILEFGDREHFSRAILFRLWLPKLAPKDWRRVLYLDADVILVRNAREIFGVDLKGAPIGAVADPGVNPAAFAARWNLPPQPAYFNSGVMLIDLDQVRADDGFGAALQFVHDHDSELVYADQDALNQVYWGRWRPIDARWNVQRAMLLKNMPCFVPQEYLPHSRRPALVQYTGPEKPWLSNVYNPYAWLYWISLKRTPFFAEVCQVSGISPKERFRVMLRWLRHWPFFG